MTIVSEAPALIQYACERCKTRFVLPPSQRRLGPLARPKAILASIGNSIRHRESLASSYDKVRRATLAKMDDDAYQSFVQSFRFCHECRQFVCTECWSNSRKTCLGCFARSTDASAGVRPKPPFAPTGPEIPRPLVGIAATHRRGRLRTSASLAVLSVAALLLVFEAGFYFIANAGSPSPSPIYAVGSGSASPSPSASPTETPADSPSESPSTSPSPSASPSPSPSPSPSDTASPSATVRITPPPLPALRATMKCSPASGTPPLTVTCTWTAYTSTATPTWYLGGFAYGGHKSKQTFSVTTDSSIQLKVTRSGKTVASDPVYYP